MVLSPRKRRDELAFGLAQRIATGYKDVLQQHVSVANEADQSSRLVCWPLLAARSSTRVSLPLDTELTLTGPLKIQSVLLSGFVHIDM